MKGDVTVPVRLPKSMIEELDKLVNVEGLFLSRSDALRHGARLVLLFVNWTTRMDSLRKEGIQDIKKQLIV
jgi:Arc/MetJ-type ribon-helix-helix transcriptional regulator